MALTPITVSQLTAFIENRLTTDPLLKALVVRGEVTSVKYTDKGIIYFSLSDESSKIDCVVWRDVAITFKDEIRKGDEIIVSGGMRVYRAMGQIQLSVRSFEFAGEGKAALAFQKLKEKLSKEGLFDEKHKKKLPEFPGTVGIVTSATGAAVEDILETLAKRTALTDGILFPVQVQGAGSAESMIRVLDYLNENYRDKLDLIIIGRGGGSPEDLAAFNDEGLARAIFRCEIPVISAVGHEIDFSISDFVADVRGETPTAAAAIAVREDRELMDRAAEAMNSLTEALSNKLMYEELSLERMKEGLENSLRGKFMKEEALLEQTMLSLKSGDIRNALKSGYALVSDEKGRFIKSADELEVDREYRLTFGDGYGKALVTYKESEDEDGK